MTAIATPNRPPQIPVPATMWALLAKGRGFDNLAIEQVPVPMPGPDQILARVEAAGVCTSILKLIDQGEDHTYINGWDMRRWPVILGDEGVVTLVRVGERLRSRFAPGERRVVQPAVGAAPIVHRERYRDGAAGMHKCAVGYTLPGHLAQYILIQEEAIAADCLLPVPDPDMAAFAASMAEPISCVYSAQERHYHLAKAGPNAPREPRLGLLPGGVAAVIGAGAMGRMHAELALRFRPRALIVSDPVPERLQRVRSTLAAKADAAGTRLLTVGPDALADTVREAGQGRGVDDMILAVGIQAVQQSALQWLADGGVANLFGGLPKGRHTLEVSALDVHYREIKLVGSSGGDPSDMRSTLDLIHSGAVNPGNYVAAVGSLDNAIDVLRMIRETRLDGKAILYPHIAPTPLRLVDGWDAEREAALLAERDLRRAAATGGPA